MLFRPSPGDLLRVNGNSYRMAEHPSAPGIVYGQEGRQGIVYQLITTNGQRSALKVFKARFRAPALVAQTQQITRFANIPGLEVCAREVLSPIRYADLASDYPDLSYAVLMPWVSGPTWLDMLLDRRALTSEQSLYLARSLALLLATMEERRLAHCDLSAPNVLLPALLDPPGNPPVGLVDVEQMYGPGLDRPEVLPGGSSGYAHRTAPAGLWSAQADRFAGAVLLAEILGWSDARVRAAAGDESYFEPQEIQKPGLRYATLIRHLDTTWGLEVASLFERAWQSATLADCPTFGEWLVALPRTLPQRASVSEVKPARVAPAPIDTVRTLLELATTLRNQGNRDGAIAAYRQALQILPPNDGLVAEIQLLIADLDDASALQLSPAVAGRTAPPEVDRPIAIEHTIPPPSVDRPRRPARWPLAAGAALLLALIIGVTALFQVQAAERATIAAAATTQADANATAAASQTALAAAHAATTATTLLQQTTTAQARQTSAALAAQQTRTVLAAAAQTATSQAETQRIAQSATARASALHATQTGGVLATRVAEEAASATAQAVQVARNAQATTAQAVQVARNAQATAQAEQAARNAQATAQAFAPVAGVWDGRTSQGDNLQFWVKDGYIVNITVWFPEAQGCGWHPSQWVRQIPIQGSSFYASAQYGERDYTISGSFSDRTNVSATTIWNYDNGKGCTMNYDITWNASLTEANAAPPIEILP